ncbi:MAG: LTA synthase family protein, partial [Muribaculaceae bacterium]|nr:LTA synthase family protein [Muribaculaceae bacterium]
LLLIVDQWGKHHKVISITLKIYLAVISFLIAATFIFDTMLYPYWGFKLDTTPLFYFSSSPKLALASVTGWQFIGGALSLIVLTTLITMWLFIASGKVPFERHPEKKQQVVSTICLGLLTAFLFVPMRGGFTVATMNLSSAYYTDDTRLNLAAVNPMFSLMYSMAHADNVADQFRFFDDQLTKKLFDELNKPVVADSAEVVTVPLKSRHPDIYLIILESFSSHLFGSLGGENIATGLDSIANSNALLFDNFYASSFRTDRGIPAILSGYPGQPTTSVMKSVTRAASLPSIASMLNDAGYTSHYYYGGDPNFTNMKAYLASTGYKTIVGDTDFPISQRLSKWGAPDAALFDKVQAELQPYDTVHPRFITIQTSSSHEPFDVARSPRSDDEPKQVTAFAYTDSCVTSFINRLHSTDNWSSSLIILVPDHYGAYPTNLGNLKAERQIPLIITGGALNVTGRNHSIGSQTDIAATIAGMLGLNSSKFKFSHDLLDPTSPRYAFYSSKGQIGLTTPDGETIYDLEADRTIYQQGDSTLNDKSKSYLQTLYRDLSSR